MHLHPSSSSSIIEHNASSLVGEPIASIVERMLDTSTSANIDVNGGDFARNVAGARSVFSIAWPPTFPVGAPAEVLELRAAMSIRAATLPMTASDGDASDAATGVAASNRDAGLAAAAPLCCSRLLAVCEGVVVGDEVVELLPGGGGAARTRLRLHADVPGVTSCILTGDQGVPTLESFQDPAPLMGLPQAARDEAHRLLWRMMHEALPPNHSVLPYDPDAFRTSVDLLPPKLQAALSWAWTHHFRPFAHDFGFLLESLPAAEAVAGGGSEVAAAAVCTPHVVAMAASSPYTADCAVAQGVEANVDELSHYQSVLAQMVVFLRDNDMFACLATLLQTAVARGLTLLGEDGASVNLAAAAAAAIALPTTPASPSMASEAATDEVLFTDTQYGSAVDRLPGPHTGAYPADDAITVPDADVADGLAQPLLSDELVTKKHVAQTKFPLLLQLPALLPGLFWAILAVARLRRGGAPLGSWELNGVSLLLMVLVALIVARALAISWQRYRNYSSSHKSCGDGSNGGTSRMTYLGLVLVYLTDAVHLAVVTWYGAAAAAAAVAAAPWEALAPSAAALAIVLLAPAALMLMTY
ncbi:hypothetical protein Vretifemale_3707 [Volvox reticuliferus]|nr:hypothetical protein Vretifemale_3707 [Volvox reticuliferus]